MIKLLEKIDALENVLKTRDEALKQANRSLMKKDYLIDCLEQRLSNTRINDDLTGLYNRNHLYSKFKELLEMQNRLGHRIVLGVFDIQNFSQVNHKYGIEFGDAILMSFGKVSRHLIRNHVDMTFRLGDDEFVIVMVDCNYKNGLRVCERIKHQFKKVTNGIELEFGLVELKKDGKRLLGDYLEHARNNLNKKIQIG